MKRLLATACAAALLTGSLTACSSNTPSTRNSYPNNNGMTNGGTAAGTGYAAPGRVRYPSGADNDRYRYGNMTNSRARYNGAGNGRYTAYSDGAVSPGHGNMARDNRALNGNTAGNNQNLGTGVARGAGDLVRGAGNAVGDLGAGVGMAARDITRGLSDTTTDGYGY